MKTLISKNIVKTIAFVLLLSASVTASASEYFTICGNVSNLSNEPLKGAKAYLINPETNKVVAQVYCNSKGKFQINDIEEGEYLLTVQKDGYFLTQSKTIIVDKEGKCTEKNIVLNDARTANLNLATVR